MDTTDLLNAFDREGRALLTAAASDPSAKVEHCPDWDVEALVGHMAMVWTYITAQVTAASPEASTRPEGDSSTPAELLDRMVALLAAADPSDPCWNWCPEEHRNVAWMVRRMAHEAAIHRWDAENAVGEASPIDADLAVDGIGEAVGFAWRWHSRGPVEHFPDGSLHLHRTDGDGEWLVRAEDGVMVVTEEHAKGDAAVRGSASDLHLRCWGRALPTLEVFGDEDLVDAWVACGP